LIVSVVVIRKLICGAVEMCRFEIKHQGNFNLYLHDLASMI